MRFYPGTKMGTNSDLSFDSTNLSMNVSEMGARIYKKFYNSKEARKKVEIEQRLLQSRLRALKDEEEKVIIIIPQTLKRIDRTNSKTKELLVIRQRNEEERKRKEELKKKREDEIRTLQTRNEERRKSIKEKILESKNELLGRKRAITTSMKNSWMLSKEKLSIMNNSMMEKNISRKFFIT